MKNKIKQIIVVEGKNDETKIKKLFNVHVLKTDGFAIDKKKFELIEKLNKKRGIIILTDEDEAGLLIRRKINKMVLNCINIHLEKNQTVEKAPLKQLEQLLINELDFIKEDTISKNDFYNLGLISKNNSSIKRNKITTHYNLKKYNAKTLLNILNMLNINIEELKEVLENE